MFSHNAPGDVITAFDRGDDDLQWRVVNDNVMGGRSGGAFRIHDGTLIFAGETNTNGGGFASIRSIPAALDLPAGADGFELRIKGDGRTYIFRVETTEGVSYWAEFETTENWIVAHVPFSGFRPRWRGSWLSGPALDPAKINSLGLMIYDGLDGAFSLEVDWISAAT